MKALAMTCRRLGPLSLFIALGPIGLNAHAASTKVIAVPTVKSQGDALGVNNAVAGISKRALELRMPEDELNQKMLDWTKHLQDPGSRLKLQRKYKYKSGRHTASYDLLDDHNQKTARVRVSAFED